MNTKKYSIVITALLFILAMAVSAGRPALAREQSAPMALDITLSPNVTLDRVSIGSDRSVNVEGFAGDLSGECLRVSLFVDGEREPWWPVFRCLDVSDTGAWSMRVSSEDGGQPMGIHLQVGQ